MKPEDEQSNLNQLIDGYVLDFEKHDPHGFLSYQKLLEPMFVLEATCKQPFESSSRTYIFKDMIFSTSLANTYQAKLTREKNHESAIGSDYIVVFFYRDYPIRIQTETMETTVEPEQIVFADLTHSLVIHTTGINVVSMNFSRNMLDELVPLGEHFHGAVFREGPHKELLVAYLNCLEKVAAEILAKDAIHVTETMVRMVANCLIQSKDKRVFNKPNNQKLSLLQLKQAIDAQIEDPRLSTETLMQQFHVSRSGIYRMFEPLGGISKYIQNRKLDYAFKELAKYSEKKQNISMLAYRLGFSHSSVFTRAFKARFEINPTEVRDKMGKKGKQELPWDFDIALDSFKRKHFDKT